MRSEETKVGLRCTFIPSGGGGRPGKMARAGNLMEGFFGNIVTSEGNSREAYSIDKQCRR